MSLLGGKLPPQREPLVDDSRCASRTWYDQFLAFASFLRSPGLPSFPVAALPPATPAGKLIYVSDEAGGAVPAFSDGVDWRRVTDRAIVS